MIMRPKLNCFSFKGTVLFALVLVLFMGGIKVSANESIPQGLVLKGVVKDKDGAMPLPGVAVVIKGTTQGTTTDIDGNFSLSAKQGDVVQFRFVGYIEKSVTVSNNNFIEVILEQDLYGIDEVVVTGYGVQKKSDLTGAVTSVSAEKLSELPIPNVEAAMQGMAAGVNIIPRSGRPGAGVDIQIRGISSINGTSPLVIIDGVSGDLKNVNPADIESIEVLKDASSAAIYGATGGNGVILVTTKSGKAGKLRISGNVYRGIESPVQLIEMMNAQEYMAVCEENEASKKNAINTRPDTLQTYNWQEIMFQQTISENYNVSLTGGNDVSRFLISSSMDKQNGIVKKTDYQRFTLRINSEHQVNSRIKVDEKVTYINTITEGYDDWYWFNFYNNPIVNVIVMDPTVPAYDETGKWSVSNFGLTNPMVGPDMKDKINRNNNFEGNFGVKITLLKGLDFNSRITGKLGFSDSKEYQGIYQASPTDYNTQDKLHQSMNKSLSYNFQNYINYQTTIANSHNISAMVGMEASKWWGYDIAGTRVDMASTDPNMLYFSKSTNGDADIQNVTGSGYIGASQAYFGRLNYDYKGRYLLTVNVRRDGASNFGPTNRWGTFPSFSFGWKFAEEEFMQNLAFISTGKIRFGYGQTGANARGNFPYLSTVVTRPEFRYTFDGLATQVGTAPNQIANPALRWESVNMSNLGLDMTFFDNRLSLNADLFNKVNDGMIMTKEVSAVAGTFNGENPEVNFGSIGNKGIEVTLGARKNHGDLTGSIDLNFSSVKNEVLSLAADSIRSGAVHNVQPTNLTYVGAPVAQFWGYEIERMFTADDNVIKKGKRIIATNQPYTINAVGDTIYAQNAAGPGDAKYKDVNNDGKINDLDKVILGSPLPKLTFGFSVNLQYKGFDFQAFFNGTYGNKIMNGTKQYLYNPVGYQNRGKAFADRYVYEDIVKLDADGNEVVVVPKNHDTDVYRMAAETYTKMSSFFVEDGSFLRLRNVVLGYTLPNSLTSKVGVEKLRLYAGGKNLFTLTKYTGFNPEVGGNNLLNMGVDIGLYPVTKMFYFGANIVF